MLLPYSPRAGSMAFLAALLCACQGAEDNDARSNGSAGSAGAPSGAGASSGGSSVAGATSMAGSAASAGGSAGAGGGQAGTGAAGSAGSAGGQQAQPTTMLPFDEWVDITPSGMEKEKWTQPGYGDCSQSGDTTADTICTYGAGSVRFDFNAPGGGVDAYVATNLLGLWRGASDGTWSRLGDPNGSQTLDETHYLPQVFDVKIDPADSNHLYLTSGVQGPQHGFYVSNDRGET
ncbi:MAG TPA: hypothetical protein VGP93_19005, partial [Polyangiaceae bacterium]|nr:hypothetical protein [Polyangiaceae bacterium]